MDTKVHVLYQDPRTGFFRSDDIRILPKAHEQLVELLTEIFELGANLGPGERQVFHLEVVTNT